MSICCIVNEKFRENVPAWEVSYMQFFMKHCHQKPTPTWFELCTLNPVPVFFVSKVFKKVPAHFPFFFKCVMEALLAGEEAGLTVKEQTVLLVFLDHCFNSLVRTAPTFWPGESTLIILYSFFSFFFFTAAVTLYWWHRFIHLCINLELLAWIALFQIMGLLLLG